MNKLIGMPIVKGIAHSTVVKIENEILDLEKGSECNSTEEIQEFHRVRGLAIADVKRMVESTFIKLGPDEAQIFNAHLSMLDDEELIGQTEAFIEEHRCKAGYAIREVGSQFEMIFESMNNDYMRERAADIKDITSRMIRHYLGIENDTDHLTEPCVIVAHDLTPSMTTSFDREFVKGIITETGGKTSHSAIIANLLEIPYVVLEKAGERLTNGDSILFDGSDGIIHVEPDEQTICFYKERAKYNATLKKQYDTLRGMPSVTEDGVGVELLANIGRVEDLEHVLNGDVKSIGLFRTEFLFMDDEVQPTEEKQYEIYKTIVSKMTEGYVTIRTIDIGGDKDSPYFEIEKEENPFLGYRGIRLCLGEINKFKAQLRAILRASAFGKIKIMFPMIATLQELDDAKALLEETKTSLDKAGISYDKDIPVGIMVETPATIVMADLFAKEVDFFSIGTNDLVQYTMAADRMNAHVSYLYSPYDPSVIRSVGRLVEAAKAEQVPVSICGESAADSKLLPVWVGLGIDKLSMTISSVPEIKWSLKQLNSQTCMTLGDLVRQKRTRAEVEEALS